MNKEISLGNGKFALVDEDMYVFLSQWRWYFAKDPRGSGYATRRERCIMSDGKIDYYTVYMHRVVAGTPIGKHTDHINGIKLDNRRSNLRICSKGENQCNIPTSNPTGLKGITRHRDGRWLSRIKYNGIHYHLGVFDTAEEAHAVYVANATELRGEFVNVNVATV